MALEGHKFSNFQGPSNEQDKAVLKRLDANSMHQCMVRIRLAACVAGFRRRMEGGRSWRAGECARRSGARAVVKTYASTYCGGADYSVRRSMSSCGVYISTFNRPKM